MSYQRSALSDQPRPDLERITQSVRYHQEEARKAARQAVAHAIAIGEELRRARKLMAAAEWESWLDSEFGWSKRHGLRYVQLAAHKSVVLARVGAEASLRQALAALGSDTRVTRDRWLVVGFLDAAPDVGAVPIDLVQQAREWRVRKG